MLWNVAKDKLYELGRLCGLVPGATVGSQQLHAVATLSTGVVDSHDEDDGQELRRPTPVDKLKEALSSQTAFTKHYLVRPRLENRIFSKFVLLFSRFLIGSIPLSCTQFRLILLGFDRFYSVSPGFT